MKKEPKAAIVTRGASPEEILQNIDLQDWLDTLVWMSEDWLEIDKLLDELGYPTQLPGGQLYPMADRFRDFCLNVGLELKEFLRHQQEREMTMAKDEEE